MSNRNMNEVRTFHERAIKELGLESCIILQGIANDLRSGVIPSKDYDQTNYYPHCGTRCCIAGYLTLRQGFIEGTEEFINEISYLNMNGICHKGLGDLFSGGRPSDPIMAANAIECYLYTDSIRPWMEGN